MIKPFIFLLLFLFSITLVSSQFGFNNPDLPKLNSEEPTVVAFDNNTGSVNSSEIWVTAQGNMDNVPDIDYSDFGGSGFWDINLDLGARNIYTTGDIDIDGFVDASSFTDGLLDITNGEITGAGLVSSSEVIAGDMNLSGFTISSSTEGPIVIGGVGGNVNVIDDLIVNGSMFLFDGGFLNLGDADDSGISYNGSDLIINPKQVGSGKVNLLDGDITTTGTGRFGTSIVSDTWDALDASNLFYWDEIVLAVYQNLEGDFIIQDGLSTAVLDVGKRYLYADDGTDVILDFSTVGTSDFNDTNIITEGNITSGNLEISNNIEGVDLDINGKNLTITNPSKVCINCETVARASLTLNAPPATSVGSFMLRHPTLSGDNAYEYFSGFGDSENGIGTTGRDWWIGDGSTSRSYLGIGTAWNQDFYMNTYGSGDNIILSDTSKLKFGAARDSEIYYDGTNLLLISNNTGSGLAWFSNNVSATGFITRTSVYDKGRGKALDFIKDSDDYIVGDKINHSEFYGYTIYNVTDESRMVMVEDKCIDDAVYGEWCDYETYPYQLEEEGVSLDMEVDLLRQVAYELKVENEELRNRLDNIEIGLAKLWYNSTCTFISSPNNLTVQEICND